MNFNNAFYQMQTIYSGMPYIYKFQKSIFLYDCFIRHWTSAEDNEKKEEAIGIMKSFKKDKN